MLFGLAFTFACNEAEKTDDENVRIFSIEGLDEYENIILKENGYVATFENGKTYQISIVNNLGTCVKFG